MTLRGSGKIPFLNLFPVRPTLASLFFCFYKQNLRTIASILSMAYQCEFHLLLFFPNIHLRSTALKSEGLLDKKERIKGAFRSLWHSLPGRVDRGSYLISSLYKAREQQRLQGLRGEKWKFLLLVGNCIQPLREDREGKDKFLHSKMCMACARSFQFFQ